MTGSLQATAVMGSELLTNAGLKHGFTTLSAGDFASPALQTHAGRERLQALGEEVGFDPDLTVTADQVHGSTIAVVHLCEKCGPGNRVPHTEGRIREEPWPLLVTTADCFPVIVYEPDSRMVAIVHCGWRGTVAGILPRAVAGLLRESGGRASQLRAAIGPGICGECYQVGDDVVQAAFQADLGSHVAADASLDRRRFDIGEALRQQLLDANLTDEHIDRVRRCNFEDADLPSFRRDRTAIRSAAVAVPDKPLVFDLVQSVGSRESASDLSRRAEALGRVIPVLLQVNVDEDLPKHGFYTASLAAHFRSLLTLEGLSVEGLMTIGAQVGSAEAARP